jgi:2-polyprenyl-3-methyl-5-hydroxy-6-metoxy-1,4-benzoquinol methylase
MGVPERVCSMIPLKKLRLLDAGCGAHRIELNMTEEQRKLYEVHRCDIVLRGEWWKWEHKDNFRVVDLNADWPYPTRFFDGVVAIEVIEHLENPRHFFREASRVAKEFIIITTPNLLSPYNRREFYEKGGFDWHNREKYLAETAPLGHITPIFIWQIEQICKDLGLKLEKVEYVDTGSKQDILIAKIVIPC